MKVAMIGLRTIGSGSGGIERAVEEISVRLAQRGHDVTVFCRGRYNQPPRDRVGGVRLVNLPALYTKHLEAISHTLLAAVRAARGFDVVHVHAIGPALLSFIPRLSGRRVVTTVHAFDWKREKWGFLARQVLRLGARCATAFSHETIVVSPTLERFFETRHHRRVRFIPNGVPAAEVRALDRLRRFGVAAGEYVLFLGRLVPEKGGHLLVEAFRALDTKLRLLVVGDATHTDTYARRLRELAAGDPRIVFTGPLFGEDKDEAYSNAACFVLPSTLEGMPIVLLEAMGYGCPVLCSDIPENLDVITAPGGARYAATFRSGSSPDLREALAQMLESLPAARERAVEAREHVRQAYSWERAAQQTEELYARLAAPGR
jgi:glycosyltransferase involved in cell wall biosynthesis